MAPILIGGIVRNDHLALLSLLYALNRPGAAAALFEALGREGISAQFIVQCVGHQGQSQLVFCVLRESMERAVDKLNSHIQRATARLKSK